MQGTTNRVWERLTAIETDEFIGEFMSFRDVYKRAVRKMNAPMWPLPIVVMACANHLHVFRFITLVPSHDLQPFSKDDLIEMEILQCPKGIQLNPISGLGIFVVTVEVSVDYWCHDRNGLCFGRTVSCETIVLARILAAS